MDFSSKITENFSGVISIKQNGSTIFQMAQGFADMPNKVPNAPDTKFGTASAGKAFVATAVLQLIEKGALNFDSTIGDILSFDLKAIDPQITVRQLLNHTSGIPDYFDESVMDEYEELWIDVPNYRMRTSADLIPLFINKPMMYPRGEKFQYNNTGYVVLGLIIEAVIKMPFDAYLQAAIFAPCNMTSTGYYEMDRLPAKCAFAYIYDEERDSYRTNIYSVDAKGTGAGGAFTTAGDVEKFWDALIGGKLVSKEMLEQMVSPQAGEDEDGDEVDYGYGLWLFDENMPSFCGSDPGVDFVTMYDMERQLSITILSNMDYDVDEMLEELYEMAAE